MWGVWGVCVCVVLSSPCTHSKSHFPVRIGKALCGVCGVCVFVLSFHPHVPRAHLVPHGSRVTSQLESVRICVGGLFVLSLHPPPPPCTQSSPCSLCGARVTSQLESVRVCVCVWGVCCPFTPPLPTYPELTLFLVWSKSDFPVRIGNGLCVGWVGEGGVCCPFTPPPPPCTQSSPCSICGVSSLII